MSVRAESLPRGAIALSVVVCVAAAVSLSVEGILAMASDLAGAGSGGRRAEAIYKIEATPHWLIEPNDFSQREFEIFRLTQIACIKSPFVLNAALRAKGINNLPLIQRQEDPKAWLGEAIEVSFPNDGELLKIALQHPTAPEEDLKKIVEAVARAYWDEVVFRERVIAAKPLEILRKAYAKLADRLERKLREYHQLAEDAGAADQHEEASRLRERELKGLIAERLSVERERHAAGLDSERAAALEPWLKTLNERVERMREEVAARGSANTELQVRRWEIERLRAVASRIETRMHLLEIEMQAPERIQPIGASSSGAAIAEFIDGDSEG